MYPKGRASRGAGIAHDARSFHPGQVRRTKQLTVKGMVINGKVRT